MGSMGSMGDPPVYDAAYWKLEAELLGIQQYLPHIHQCPECWTEYVFEAGNTRCPECETSILHLGDKAEVKLDRPLYSCVRGKIKRVDHFREGHT